MAKRMRIFGFKRVLTLGLLLCSSMAGSAQMPETTGIGMAPPASGAQQGAQTTSGQPSNAPPTPGVENSASAITGQASGAGQASGYINASGQQAAASLQISLGDLLEISVFDTPELSSRLRVNNRGDILLPLAGYVHVEGLTGT